MQQQLYLQHYLYLHYAAVTSAMLFNTAAAAILTALLILTLRSYTYSITYTYITQLCLQHYLYLHYAAVTSAMLLNAAAAAAILTALLILTLRSYTYSITYTYITQLYLQHYLYLHYAAMLTALLILTLRSYTYITQQ